MTEPDISFSPERIERAFTRDDGSYFFARWGRPIAPVVFGVDEATLGIVKGAIEATAALAGHKMAEVDPELGSNLMIFFLRDWQELAEVPDLDHLVPDLVSLLSRLEAQDANQYRFFRFDEEGAIKAGFVFIRMDRHLSQMSAESLALAQVAQIMLVWSEGQFRDQSPLLHDPDKKITVLHPEISALITAAYDPIMPAFADDPSHALRLFARIGAAI